MASYGASPGAMMGGRSSLGGYGGGAAAYGSAAPPSKLSPPKPVVSATGRVRSPSASAAGSAAASVSPAARLRTPSATSPSAPGYGYGGGSPSSSTLPSPKGASPLGRSGMSSAGGMGMGGMGMSGFGFSGGGAVGGAGTSLSANGRPRTTSRNSPVAARPMTSGAMGAAAGANRFSTTLPPPPSAASPPTLGNLLDSLSVALPFLDHLHVLLCTARKRSNSRGAVSRSVEYAHFCRSPLVLASSNRVFSLPPALQDGQESRRSTGAGRSCSHGQRQLQFLRWPARQ
jgi:hypothetical protein